MGSVTTVGTGLTGFSWSLPGMEASARSWLWGEVWREAVVQVMRAGCKAWLRHGGRQGQRARSSLIQAMAQCCHLL